jgi:hypothetical protein
MKRSQQLILLVAFQLSILYLNSYAQELEKPSFEKSNIQDQFNFVIEKSNHYQDFKVVKLTWLNDLKASVTDSLKRIRKEIINDKKQLLVKQAEIDTLHSELKQINATLSSSNNERDSIPFLFFQMNKHHYAVLVWLIIGILTLVLLIFFFLYKRSQAVTDKTQLTLAETKEEFEAHRKRALEREAKLGRDYLKELNKYKNK